MKRIIATAAATLLVLGGCTSSPESSEDPPTPETSVTPAEPTETPVTLGEPFTLDGPHFTAHVTIEEVYLPDQCGDYDNELIALITDVEIEDGDGAHEVLDGTHIRERTPEGDIEEDRVVSNSCGDITNLEARNVQAGDSFQGARWLNDDVNTESEILFHVPAPAETPVTEMFVLDLSEIDIAAPPEATPDEAVEPDFVQEPTENPDLPAQPTVAEPYIVECLFGTPGPSLMSDGTIQNTDFCANQPGAEEQRYLEGNCSNADWRLEMELEGDRLCGSNLFEEGNVPWY